MSFASLSGVESSRGPSSASTVLFSAGMMMGSDSFLNCPALAAATARRWLSAEKASMSARVIWKRSATSSADVPAQSCTIRRSACQEMSTSPVDIERYAGIVSGRERCGKLKA